MSLDIRHFSHVFTFPAKIQPAWSERVDRWYQLDAYAYALADAFFCWRQEITRPSLIILASPGGSNETDRDFTRTGAMSPNKFVHTLPSVRGSSLYQVMEWTGPVLCFQKDPSTFLAGLEEALLLVGDSYPTVWVKGVFRKGPGSKAAYTVHCLQLSQREANFASPFTIEVAGMDAEVGGTDADFVKWLAGGSGERLGGEEDRFVLSNGRVLRR